MKRNNKIVIITCLVLALISFSMYFILDKKESKNEEIVGDISFTYVDKSVYIKDAIPTLDKFGIMNEAFIFTIKNNSLKAQKYTLSLQDNGSTIKNSDIRYELTKNNDVLTVSTLPNDGIIDIGEIHGNEEIKYSIKLWLDYNSEYVKGTFNKKISIIVGEDDEVIVNEPILDSGMIPVYYDYDNNSWYKADITSKWYNYNEQKWANAVTINANTREYYQKAESNTKILNEDINSFWVWIPRFNYSLKNSDIMVNFVPIDEEAYKAFTFNEEELSGFWIAKYEAGLKEDSICIKTKNCNNSNNQLYFVPNFLYANRITMANMFYNIRKMELTNNIYGFTPAGNKLVIDGTIANDKNNLDIHMIKNSEWQAVALLSESKYGINYQKKLITNNGSDYTGKATIDGIDYDYNVLLKGEGSSTTGNVTGVYDMAGGMREYTMITNSEIDLFNGRSNSGFSVMVKDYYFDNNFRDDTTLQFKDRYSEDNDIGDNPITRGGYKNTGNIFNVYSASDFNKKISLESNSRAIIVIKEK